VEAFAISMDWARTSASLMAFDPRVHSGDPEPFQAFLVDYPGLADDAAPTNTDETWIGLLAMLDDDTVRLLAYPRGYGSWQVAVVDDPSGARWLEIAWGGVVAYPVEHPVDHRETVMVFESRIGWEFGLTGEQLDGSIGYNMSVNPDGVDMCASFEADGIVADYDEDVDLSRLDVPVDELGQADDDITDLAALVAQCRGVASQAATSSTSAKAVVPA